MATSIKQNRRSSTGPWLLALAVLLGSGLLLFRNKDQKPPSGEDFALNQLSSSSNAAFTGGSEIDLQAPLLRYPEVVNLDVEVRGDEHYAIYSLDPKILFESGSAQFRPGTEEHRMQILQSVRQRFAAGKVQVIGTDDAGDRNGQTPLARARAAALRQWLLDQGLEEGRIDEAPSVPQLDELPATRIRVIARRGQS